MAETVQTAAQSRERTYARPGCGARRDARCHRGVIGTALLRLLEHQHLRLWLLLRLDDDRLGRRVLHVALRGVHRGRALHGRRHRLVHGLGPVAVDGRHLIWSLHLIWKFCFVVDHDFWKILTYPNFLNDRK